jgi:hypothetical protein
MLYLYDNASSTIYLYPMNTLCVEDVSPRDRERVE